jgi:Domain of unknown function (DUF4349)
MTANYRRTIFLAGSVLLTGLLVAGCGASSSADKAASSGSGISRGGAAAAPEKAPDPAAADGATAKDSPDLSVDQRSIIYRGAMTVRVKDVTAAASQATGIAQTAGGFIGSDNRDRGSGDDTATMELRVPADKFAVVVGQLSKLGREESRQISTEDVTEQTVDLDARLAVQQARVDSGRRLLAQAKSLTDLVMLEREVATRESDLASLQAKKRRLSDLTTLSTITLVLLDPKAVKEADDGPPGFLSGLSGGWDALVSSLAVLLTVLGALLPWLLAVGIPLWLILYLVRRFGRRRTRSDVEPVPAFAGTGGLLPYGARPAGPVTEPDSAPPASSDAPAQED